MALPAASTATLTDGLLLDARRAVWLPGPRTLAVADTHLGYAWAQRTRGALLPVSALDDTTERLVALQRDHRPDRIVVLGDVVHRAVALPALEASLRDLCARLSPASELVFCLGNHDHKLDRLVAGWGLPVVCRRQLRLGGHLLLHGDIAPEAADDGEGFRLQAEAAPRAIIGHEHPAITLGDGVASSAKCPAFLVADDLVVMPAFSPWAAGCELGARPFLGPLARAARFQSAFACVGPRLLRLPLKK